MNEAGHTSVDIKDAQTTWKGRIGGTLAVAAFHRTQTTTVIDSSRRYEALLPVEGSGAAKGYNSAFEEEECEARGAEIPSPRS